VVRARSNRQLRRAAHLLDLQHRSEPVEFAFHFAQADQRIQFVEHLLQLGRVGFRLGRRQHVRDAFGLGGDLAERLDLLRRKVLAPLREALQHLELHFPRALGHRRPERRERAQLRKHRVDADAHRVHKAVDRRDRLGMHLALDRRGERLRLLRDRDRLFRLGEVVAHVAERAQPARADVRAELVLFREGDRALEAGGAGTELLLRPARHAPLGAERIGHLGRVVAEAPRVEHQLVDLLVGRVLDSVVELGAAFYESGVRLAGHGNSP